MPILAWLMTKLGSGFVTALVGQFAAIYAKSKDTKLAGLQAVVGASTTEDTALLSAQVETNRIREAASHSKVAMTIVGLVAIPAALHWALICLDSSVKLGCGHYGCLGIPPLPGAYEADARAFLQSFFVLAPALPVATGLAVAAQKLAAKL